MRLPSFLAISLLLAAGCASGLGTDEPDDGPDAGTKFDDPRDPREPDEPEPDAGMRYTCTGGTASFEHPQTGHCYILYSGELEYETAEIACDLLEGPTHLVVINDQEEHDFVRTLIGGAQAWIGGTDRDAEGDWVWATGEAFSFTNWRSGEPNDGGGDGEDCMIFEGNRGGTWDDRRCRDNYNFVCEREY